MQGCGSSDLLASQVGTLPQHPFFLVSVSHALVFILFICYWHPPITPMKDPHLTPFIRFHFSVKSYFFPAPVFVPVAPVSVGAGPCTHWLLVSRLTRMSCVGVHLQRRQLPKLGWKGGSSLQGVRWSENLGFPSSAQRQLRPGRGVLSS